MYMHVSYMGPICLQRFQSECFQRQRLIDVHKTSGSAGSFVAVKSRKHGGPGFQDASSFWFSFFKYERIQRMDLLVPSWASGW